MTPKSDAYTGTKAERPEFEKLLKKLKEGDTLTVTKLDRIARLVDSGSKIIKELLERGTRVEILNIGIIEDTPAGRLIFNIMSSFAEFERDMIIERTNEGRAIARQKPNYREGRPTEYSKQQIQHALELLETHSYKQVEEKLGISKSTLIRTKRKAIVK